MTHYSQESLLTQQRVDLVRPAQERLLTVELFEPGTLPLSPSDRLDLKRRYADAVGLARGLRVPALVGNVIGWVRARQQLPGV